MKITFTTVLISLVSAVMAAPASPIQAREKQAGSSFFGGGKDGNFVSDIFDESACIVSSIIGGGDPRCRGKGSA